MSRKFLFAAEVNQIQKTLFAADLQRQIVGGSRLLDVFMEQGSKLALENYRADQVISSAGGNFRIVFTDPQNAADFGRHLADAYNLLLNGVMTIAQPEPFLDNDENCRDGALNCRSDDPDKCYRCAEEILSRRLNDLKQGGRKPVSLAHAPTTALCESSGVALATRFESPLPGKESNRYTSEVAHITRIVGLRTKLDKNRTENGENEFLNPIREKITNPAYQALPWASVPEDMAYWDLAKRNVAYMVADGNNMGIFFSLCQTKEERSGLSLALQKGIEYAIADPISPLMDRLWASSRAADRPMEIPVLPLILAGDDIFVLLPAPYAFDYARHFCSAFTNYMKNHEVVAQLRAKAALDGKHLPEITMSAAVVICKQNYPYHLAHDFGEESLLSRSKLVTKRVGLNSAGEWLSSISIGLIIGSEGINGLSFSGPYRPALTTYWASSPEKQLAQKTTIDINTLLDYRLKLSILASKRRAELRDLFDHPPLNHDDLLLWNKRLERLFKRLQVTDPDGLVLLKQALADLGDPEANPKSNPAHWRKMEDYHVHGLPDLFAVWPYAQLLKEDLDLYHQEGEG